MKKPSYWEGVAFIAHQEPDEPDPYWVKDMPTAKILAHLFGVSLDRVAKDVIVTRKKTGLIKRQGQGSVL